MDPRKTESTLGSSTTATDDDVTDKSEQALDYQEHMEQRHRDAGQKVIGAAKHPELKSDIDPRMEQLLDGCAELIKEKRDVYYVAGQKMWLASEDAKHQTDPMSQIVDGFFEEQLRESESMKGYAERNPKSFAKFQTAVALRASERLADSEFTPEQQHALKYQALQEFIGEGQNLGGWATDGRLTTISPSVNIALENAKTKEQEVPRKYWYYRHLPTLKGRVYTEKHETDDYRNAKSETTRLQKLFSETAVRQQGKEILRDEGFLTSDQELDDIRSIAKQVALEREISANPYSFKYGGIIPSEGYGYKNVSAIRRYERLFNFELKRADIASFIANTDDEKHENLRISFREQLKKGYYEDGPYVRFVNPLDIQLDAEKIENFRNDAYDAIFNILLTEGRYGPSKTILSHNREFAANRYFEVFNCGEHMDELNEQLVARIEELHDNGEDDRAKLLKRRFSQWSKNETVANAFQEYSDLVATRQHREEQDPRGNNLQVWHDTPISDFLDRFDDIYGGRDNIYLGDRFHKAHGVGARGEGEISDKNNFMPRDVARERINALKQWSDFIKENIPDADAEEALMVFDSEHDTLADAMSHLDGNTYAVISFNYAGKRCMIAECLGFNVSGASAGAMKIWMGELDDRRGWETAFNRSKTEAAVRGDCESINHTNIVDEVINRETDSDDYIVDAEDVMFKLALRYFESDGTNKDILKNNATNRQQLADLIGPQMWRPNAEA